MTLTLNEISGRALQAIAPYLPKFRHIQPHQWLPFDTWLDVLDEMYQTDPDETASLLQQMGCYHAETFMLGFDLETALHHLASAYHMNHRGLAIGTLITERLGPKRFRIISNIPYPDDYLFGIILGLSHRYLSQDFKLTVDPSIPTRDAGGEFTIIEVHWS